MSLSPACAPGRQLSGHCSGTQQVGELTLSNNGQVLGEGDTMAQRHHCLVEWGMEGPGLWLKAARWQQGEADMSRGLGGCGPDGLQGPVALCPEPWCSGEILLRAYAWMQTPTQLQAAGGTEGVTPKMDLQSKSATCQHLEPLACQPPPAHPGACSLGGEHCPGPGSHALPPSPRAHLMEA